MFCRSSFTSCQTPVTTHRFGEFSLLERAKDFFGLDTTDYLHANVERQRVTYRLRYCLTKTGYDYVYLDFTKPTEPVLSGRTVTLRRVLNARSTD